MIDCFGCFDMIDVLFFCRHRSGFLFQPKIISTFYLFLLLRYLQTFKVRIYKPK